MAELAVHEVRAPLGLLRFGSDASGGVPGQPAQQRRHRPIMEVLELER